MDGTDAGVDGAVEDAEEVFAADVWASPSSESSLLVVSLVCRDSSFRLRQAHNAI